MIASVRCCLLLFAVVRAVVCVVVRGCLSLFVTISWCLLFVAFFVRCCLVPSGVVCRCSLWIAVVCRCVLQFDGVRC